MIKTKSDVVRILGGGKLGQAAVYLDITSQALTMWPEKLNQKQIDRAIGACWRLGLLKKKAKA